MIRSSVRGMSAIPFILALVLFLIAGYLAYHFNSQLEEALVQEREADTRAKAEAGLRGAVIDKLKEAATNVGWSDTGTAIPEVNIVELAKARQALMAKYPASRVSETGLTWSKEESDLTLELMLKDLSAALDVQIGKVKQLETELETKRDQLASESRKQTERETQLDTRVGELEANLRVTEEERDKNREDREKAREELQEVQTNLRDEMDRQRKEDQQKIRETERTLGVVRGDLERLRIKEDVVHARADEIDGSVVEANMDLNLVYLDLTLEDGLRVGTRFDVIRIIKGSVEVFIGVVDVRKVNDQWAECNVLTLTDPMSPIVAGDKVRNPIYDPKRQRVFTFAGSTANPLYSREEMSRMIEEFGGKVIPTTDVTTDVIVLGAGYESDPNFIRGQELHLEAITEAELLRVVGR